MKRVIKNDAGEITGVEDMPRSLGQKVVGAFIDPYTAADDELFEKSDVLAAIAAQGSVISVGTSKLTRKRVSEGKAPILKAFF